MKTKTQIKAGPVVTAYPSNPWGTSYYPSNPWGTNSYPSNPFGTDYVPPPVLP